MNISALSIRRPLPAILLFILLSLAGWLGFRAMPVQDFPDIELPMVTVTATLPGAAPAQLETEVARKIEDSIASLQGLKNTHTTVLDGTATVIAEFVLDKNTSDAVNEVRDAVARIRADLPGDLRDPTVTKVATAGRVVLTFAATSSSLDQQALSWFVDNTVTKRLLSVPGVGAVKRVGGVSREVQVQLDPQRMMTLGTSAFEVSRHLKQVQQEAPGGRGDINGAEQTVRTLGNIDQAKDLGQIDIPLTNGRSVRLSQVATIRDTVAESREAALYNGQAIVAFEVFRTKGASELKVAEKSRAAMAQLEAAIPSVHFENIVDNARIISENFEGSMSLLYEGAVLAVLVVWLFLREWRATWISAAALPLSVLPAFWGMQALGYSLNTVTLTSLALVVGVLVDDAIVEIENITRHLHMGKSPLQAALEAADEIGLAVVATTLALVAVFLPTAFMGGVPGLFFKQFGWTAVLAIVSSLLVARLLTPMMAAYILKPSSINTHTTNITNITTTTATTATTATTDGFIMRSYMTVMQAALRHRWLTLGCAVLFFVGSLFLLRFLPTGFVPAADRNQTQINLELPPGSTLEETWQVAEQARLLAQQVSGVVNIYSSIGGGSSGDAFAPGTAPEARKAVLTVMTTHYKKRPYPIRAIESQLRDQLAVLPGVRINVGPPDTGIKMQLVLVGEDSRVLMQTADQVEQEMRLLPGIGHVKSNAALVRPEIRIYPDFSRAADMGVSTESLAQTIRVATFGDYDTFLPKMNLPERQVPIRVMLPLDFRHHLDNMAHLSVPATGNTGGTGNKTSSNSGSVLLGQIAQIQMDSGPAEIHRLNRSRSVTFEVELGSRTLGEVNQEARQLPTLSHLPAGIRIAELGDAQEMQELFASFGIAMLIGVFCIYGVLVLLFNDFLQPLTLLGALPLSIGGAFVGLLVAHQSLSMPSMIGLIMLMGIVTKNSILLVEYAIVARRGGPDRPAMSRFDALVDACHKRSRPIVMTTIAMGAGMFPLAMGWGTDPSFRSPMAITVLGGLITSTLLSLFVIPAAFTVMDDLQNGLRSLKRRYFR
jgi:multidrug efflux pump subunit AcrB